ncbi:leucine-rich repeat-containing protein 24-like [Schistocerca americana]|uniref:leucine-rich repeat-containing protein 24-like n=1 Tax=Schistocerca americana TaxID=7009 RepID=UPI001F4F194D|nr:leucine-rich repeat-containing protein 24-like [Schistocerca americana]
MAGALLVVQLRLLALLVLAAAAPDWSDCPSACQCKWTGGKKSALCRAAGLSAVPNALSAEMQLLDLSDNRIPYLTRDAFRSVGLINLQKIFARQAGVREVHRDAFRDLIILVEVDLSGNAIAALQPGTFSGNDRLRMLSLSHNPLSELVEGQFPALPHLRTLDLSHCRLARVHPAAFARLSALETLHLNNNRLQQLDAAALNVAAATLKAVALDSNPWRCDCGLRALREWLLARTLHGALPPACAAPATLAGRPWPDVPAHDFACAPEVSLADHMIQAELGGNVTFRCHVTGDPEPTLVWLVNGRALGAGNASGPEAVPQLEEEVDADGRGRWYSLSLYNVSEADAGDYACVATNIRGRASGNASLLLPQVVTATTLSKADGWLVWAGVAAGGGVALGGALLAVACSVCAACRPGRGRRHRHRGRHKRRKPGSAGLKGSVSFTDQEKKLLDASITTTERPSCSEGLAGSQPDMELLEQQQVACGGMEAVPPPVHITIESHPSLPGAGEPGACAGAAGGGAYPGALSVFPPPPAEFSTSVLPAGAFGNIFISVSVSQPVEPEQRYPDLLDIPHRSGPLPPPGHAAPAAPGGGKAASVSVAAGPDAPFYVPRVLATHAYATLPRARPGATQRKEEVVPPPPLAQPAPPHGQPHYDNMGPRVTAGGSSTLSLPDALPPDSEADADADAPDDIPPPPLPPMCSPLPAEYVAL